MTKTIMQGMKTEQTQPQSGENSKFLEEALVQCGGDQMEGRTISPEKSPTIGPTAIASLVRARSQEQNFMHVSRAG